MNWRIVKKVIRVVAAVTGTGERVDKVIEVISGHKEETMNWEDIEHGWGRKKTAVRQMWPKLTDEDLDHINGARERLLTKLQERYGKTRAEAEVQAEEWRKGQSEEHRDRDKGKDKDKKKGK
jgi:uncharacterized protein YjbJ (UPF0337 family)